MTNCKQCQLTNLTTICQTPPSDLKRSSKNLEHGFGHHQAARRLGSGVRCGQLRRRVVGIRIPERVRDEFDAVRAPAAGHASVRDLLPSRLRREVCAARGRDEALPVPDRKVDRGLRIEGEAREIDA